ncbi:MAG TPA: hypothetical protein VE907_11780 [Gammaproteobacteria bacterium]|nr:hypothetical protein [Gammaproteobacteria bacterium]
MKGTTRPALAALLLSLTLSFPSLNTFAQESRFVGSWVLDAAKSKAPLMPSSATVVISDAGGGKFRSVSDTSAGGQTIHSEITFAVDGKDYVAQTDPALPPGTSLTQSFEKMSPTSYKTTLKLRGQEVASTVQELSADGLTMTLTSTAGTNASMSTLLVFNRR